MSGQSSLSISAVVPAFNEEACIASCVHALEAALVGITDDFEIIVVNDGSDDRTGAVLDRIQLSQDRLRVVHLPVNGGLGHALRSGFRECGKDLVFYSDADLPCDYRILSAAIEAFAVHGADLLTGFRRDRRGEGLRRIVYSVTYNQLIRLLFGVRIKDVNFSFKLIARRALERLDLQSRGSFIDAELVVKAVRLNLTIHQIEVDYRRRQAGTSHLSSAGTILTILRELAFQYPSLARKRWSRC
jgi:glycosyltransferase involved in cell wall biosynthesis